MPIFFILIVSFTIIYQVRLAHNDRRRNPEGKLRSYLQADNEANFARLKPLDSHMLITVNKSELPFRYGGGESQGLESKVLASLSSPLIKTGILTNIELKERFGAKNLERIANGEENHTRFIQNLNKWAQYLIEAGNIKDAETVLTAAIKYGSDISETYALLYKLYIDTGRQESAKAVLLTADNLPETAKKLILSKIERISK